MSCEDIVFVQQLVCREREARDREWWEEMRSTYAEDSFVNLSWYQGNGDGFVDGSIAMARKGASSKHKLGPVVVRVKGERAVATLSATIESRTNINGVEADLSSDTRLIYKARKRSQKWEIVGLECLYESDKLSPTLPGQQIVIDSEELKKYRSSYRYLSLVLERKGFPVNTELVGDDRPGGVKRVYDETFAWLQGNETT